jgi:outer membrane usher protein
VIPTHSHWSGQWRKARLRNGDGEIGDSGYAIMPYLSAYRENRVGLDTSTLKADVEVKSTSSIAIPRSGSIVLVNFETDEGRSAVIELQRSDKGFILWGQMYSTIKVSQSAASVRRAKPTYAVSTRRNTYWSGEAARRVDVT